MSAAIGTSPLMDWEQIAMLRGLRGGALIKQLMRTYREQAATDVAAIAAAVAAGDLTAARQVAHTLKSASLNVGARRIGELAAEIETAVRSGNVDVVPGLAAALGEAHGLCLPEIEALM